MKNKQPIVRDLMHADQIYKLMDTGLSFKRAALLDDASAKLMIEAWEIAMGNDDDDDSGTLICIGHIE